MINKMSIEEAKKRLQDHAYSLCVEMGYYDRVISFHLYEIISKIENKNVSFSFLLNQSICNFFNRNTLIHPLIIGETYGRTYSTREFIRISAQYARVLIEAGLGIKNEKNPWETIMFDGSIFDALYRPNRTNKYKVSKLKFHYLRMQNE